MRAAFDRRVGPSRSADTDRFVWDYWHVPGKYTYFRTHPRRFFRHDLYGQFIAALRQWGVMHLGCDRISEPWLSYYIDGCRQELHTDAQQGQWAYVFSLTRWDDRRFVGGETLVLGTAVLDYWPGFAENRSLEAEQILVGLPTPFNQLTVFDARIPHGVARVEGTHDPMDSRVVLHGWFHSPSLRVHGSLRPTEAASTIAQIRESWRALLTRVGPLSGIATWRLALNTDGSVAMVDLIADTLVAAAVGARTREGVRTGVLDEMNRQLRDVQFPRSAGETVITLPLSTTDS
jgi:hypothetical protein